MKKVGICFHPQWPAAQALAQEVKGALAPHVSEVWLTSAWDEGEARLNLEGTDLLICVGGDGTMLWAARLVILQHTLLLGINMGRLGFLAELRAEEALAKAKAKEASELHALRLKRAKEWEKQEAERMAKKKEKAAKTVPSDQLSVADRIVLGIDRMHKRNV